MNPIMVVTIELPSDSPRGPVGAVLTVTALAGDTYDVDIADLDGNHVDYEPILRADAVLRFISRTVDAHLEHAEDEDAAS